MPTFYTRKDADEATWWEIQHRWPEAESPGYRDVWGGSSLGHWGPEAAKLTHEARQAGVLDSDYRFAHESDAVAFLLDLKRVAKTHQTVAFRVVKVQAWMTTTEIIEAAPIRVCGHWMGTGYCGEEPDHKGDHVVGYRAR